MNSAPDIYTAVYGDRDQLRALPSGTTGRCYTDQRGLAGEGWTVRYAPIEDLGTPRLRAKYWKVFPALAMPDSVSSLWVDANVQLFEGWEASVIPSLGRNDACLFRHPDRTSILQEAMECRQEQPVGSQARHYVAKRRWRNVDGLFASGVMTRKHTLLTRRMSAVWWDEIMSWTHHDQISMPIAVKESCIRYSVFPGNFWHQSWFQVLPHSGE